MKDIIRGIMIGLLLLVTLVLVGCYAFIYWFMCFIVWLSGQA